MNLHLHHVVSDVDRATGLRIMRAIIDAESDVEALRPFATSGASLQHKSSKPHFRCDCQQEHIFALNQASISSTQRAKFMEM
ncbi:MAG: hypothetical protein ABIV63_02135, partial [Caldimonas sp.]